MAALYRLAVQKPKAKFIFPGDSMCREALCLVRLNGEFLYRDAAHIRRNLSLRTNRELALLIGLDQIFTASAARE